MIGSQRALTLGLFIVATPLAAAPVLLDDAYTPTSAVFVVPAPGVLANDSSASGGLRVLSLDITGLQGTVTAFPNGRFSFTPAPGLATDTSFRYTATDNGGGLAAATVRFDMVSTLPLALPDNYTPNGATFVVPAAQGLLANDSGGIGTLQVLSLDITGTQGTVTAFADGRFSFTPAPGLATDTSFAYTLVDSAGRTAKATAFFDMVSTLPVAVNDSYTPNAANFFVPAAQGLLANDSGGIGTLQVLSLDITGTQGTVTAFADGRFGFTPDPGLATDTSFAYTLVDSAGRTRKATAFFDMVSTLPVAVDDIYTLNATTLNVPVAQGVLANDSGGIGKLQVLSLDITGTQGTVTAFSDGHFSFTPDPGLATDTSFAYTMLDEAGRTRKATVLLDVLSTLPVGVDDFYDLLGAGPFSTTALDGLLGNDRGGLGGLELAGVDDSGLQGTLTVLADGSFTFDPRSGFRGTTSFDYVLVDALGRTSRSTATLRVGPAFPVPEPATAALLLIAGGALCARRQRHGAWAAGRSRSATLCAVRAG